MKYDRTYRQYRSSGERGVALFFALGILAVLIVVVLMFANRARTDLKIASAYANSGQARHLAESALSRALIQLQKNTANTFYFYSSSINDSNNVNTVDWLWKIGTSEFPVGQNNPMRWQYVKAPIDGQEQIIGRFAYHAIGFNPMDLNALLIHQKGLCGDAETIGGGTCAFCTKRLGRSVAELNFDPTPFTTAFTKDILNGKGVVFPHFDYLKFALNLQDKKDIAAINERFAIGLGDSMKELDVWQADKDGTKFFQRFNLNRTDWDSITVDDIVTTPSSSVLTAIEADKKSADFKNILWLAKWNDTEGGWSSPGAKAKQIAANLINYNRSYDKDVVSNIAPENWGSTTPEYTGNKRTWYINETMLNLSAQPFVDGPHVVKDADGNFRYQYWNLRLIVKLQLATEIINMYKDVYGGTGTNEELLQFLKYYGKVSFNYKKNSYTLNGNDVNKTQTESSYEWDLSKVINANETVNADSIRQSDWSINGNYKMKSIIDAGTGNNHLSKELDLGSYAQNTNEPLHYQDVFKLSNIKLEELKIVLSDIINNSRKNVDYAHVSGERLGGDGGGIKDLSGDGLVDLLDLSFQVSDARHNLLPACWEEKGGIGASKLNEKNTFNVDSDNPNNDKEIYDDPTAGKISTAYIRHGQMESLWELGAIHRAAPWQTINLKKPSPEGTLTEATADFSDVGGGKYRDGDFMLLDHVTFRSSDDANSKAKGQFGKINLVGPLSIKKFSWFALFDGAKEMKAYNATPSADNLYDVTDIYSNLDAAIASVNSGNLFRRSDIFRTTNPNFWGQFIPSSCETDVSQEERICRFINLTKVHNQGFDSAVVVVLAQSIKDVGGGVEIPVDWDENGDPGSRSDANRAAMNAGFLSYDGKTAEYLFGTSAVAIPAANASEAAAFGKYDIGVDKITGTAKMLAFYKYDNIAKKWKLIRVKHEE